MARNLALLRSISVSFRLAPLACLYQIRTPELDTMQLIANRARAIARTHDASHQFAGLLIISLFPALFWTSLIAGIGAAVGHTPSLLALATFAAAVAAFLAAVGHALIARS